MAEYIERDKILGYMDLVVIHARGVAGNDSILKKVTDIIENMRDIVAEAPAADVVPVVHGRWIATEQENGCTVWNDYTCSVCGSVFDGNDWLFDEWKGCPVCLARMDGE